MSGVVSLLTAFASAGGEIAKYLNLKEVKKLINEWVANEKEIALVKASWPNIDDAKLETLFKQRKLLDEAMLKQAALIPSST